MSSCQILAKLIAIPTITMTTGIGLVFVFAAMISRAFPHSPFLAPEGAKKGGVNVKKNIKKTRSIITAMTIASGTASTMISIVIYFDFFGVNQCHDAASMYHALSLPFLVAYMGYLPIKVKPFLLGSTIALTLSVLHIFIIILTLP